MDEFIEEIKSVMQTPDHPSDHEAFPTSWCQEESTGVGWLPPSAVAYCGKRAGVCPTLRCTSRAGSAPGFGRNICDRSFETSVV